MTASSRNKLVLAMALASVALPAHASLSTTVTANGGFNTDTDNIYNTQTVNDSSTASASASTYYPNNTYQPYGPPLTGSASVSASVFEGGALGTSVSSNNGTAPNGIYETVSTQIDSRWNDTFNFAGNGTATMHFVLDGTMSGYQTTNMGYQYGSLFSLSLFTQGQSSYASFSSVASNGSALVQNGSFHQIVDATMTFYDATQYHGAVHSADIIFDANGSTGTSSLTYSVKLDSVTFAPNTTPGVILSNSSGALQFAVPVPEAESYAMMLAGLGVIGFIAWRRKNQYSNMTFA
jgi:hypothetical protein